MPFTPFHFGPSACIALPFHKWIDVISFVFVSIVIDVEPFLVMLFDFNYPLHGYAHTFIGAGVLGALWGIAVFEVRRPLIRIFAKFRISYVPTAFKTVVSGILGGFFHVLMDVPLYTDIKPFYPSDYNPFYGLISHSQMHIVSGALFIICGLYLWYRSRNS